MDKKFRISFYPSDASRIKQVSLSRRLAVLSAAVILPLSCLGFWLLFAGPLHPSKESGHLREKLTQENRALGDRVGKLNQDLRGLQRDLLTLEEQKVTALLISGVEYTEAEKRGKSSSLFSFFQGLGPTQIDVSASLDKARLLSARLDTTLEILARQGSLVEGLPTTYPVARDAIITRQFGYSPDPFTGRKALHAGVDFSLRAGSPVFASGAGLVAETGKDLLWGQCVKIDHGRGAQTFYAHLQEILVRKGQTVARGEPLGLMGMTGVATGVHLHYELSIRGEKADPMKYFLPELVLSPALLREAPAQGAGAPPAAEGSGT